MPKSVRERGHIAEKLDYFARLRGFQQAEIHEQMKGIVSEATINDWFQGVSEPSLSDGFQLAKILGVSLNELADASVSVDAMKRRGVVEPSRIVLEYFIDTIGIEGVLEAARRFEFDGEDRAPDRGRTVTATDLSKIPPSGADSRGRIRHRTPEESKAAAEAFSRGLEEIDRNAVDDPTDTEEGWKEFARSIDERRPHRKLFEGMY